MRTLLLMMLIASPVLGGDSLSLLNAPLNILTERVDKLDQQVCDLDERIRQLELDREGAVLENAPSPVQASAVQSPVPVPVAVQSYDYDGALIVPGSTRIIERVNTVAVVQPKPMIAPVRNTIRRLRTRAELQRAISAARTNVVYGRMARGQQSRVWYHLTASHGYTSAQVAGLSLSDALMLHNLAHGPKISAWTTGAPTTSVVTQSVTAPSLPVQAVSTTNCANGQCFRSSSSNSSTRSRWYLGRRLGW